MTLLYIFPQVLARYNAHANEYHSVTSGQPTEKLTKSVAAKLREGRMAEHQWLRDSGNKAAYTNETRRDHLSTPLKVAYQREMRGVEHGDEKIEAVRVACENDGVRRINEMQRRIEEDALLCSGVRRTSNEYNYMKSLETVGRSRRKLEPSHPRPDAIPYRKRPSDVQLETALMKDKLLGLGYHNHESRVRLDTNWHEGTASAMVVAKHYIGRDNQGKKTVLTSNY